MANVRLEFLNKNMYRKYPIKATSTHVFTDGVPMPQTLITSAQVSTIYGHHHIYISKIYLSNGYINVTLMENDNTIGWCAGKITNDFQILPLQTETNYIAGSMTFGTVNAVNSLNGCYFLNPNDGMLEESTVFCFTPPALKAIHHENTYASGDVTFTTNNIKVATTSGIFLSVINTTQIATNNDKNASYNNCGTPLITKINTVEPNSEGNIDIYSILPVQITIGTGSEAGEIIIDTPTLTLDDVCPERNLKLAPTDDSDAYYTNILTTTTPEWQTWS